VAGVLGDEFSDGWMRDEFCCGQGMAAKTHNFDEFPLITENSKSLLRDIARYKRYQERKQSEKHAFCVSNSK